MLLCDGAQGAEIPWEDARQLIRAAPPANVTGSMFPVPDGLYGCNMAYRTAAIRQLRFDERLVLYGWMEDRDFSRLAEKIGRLAGVDTMTGVHLGVKAGRVSGRKYGYSQVVNAWYLYKKGVLSVREACSNLFRALLMNSAKALWPEKHIDRLGRLTGNLIGVGDLMLGRGHPERAAEL